jgi:hypothetical protein
MDIQHIVRGRQPRASSRKKLNVRHYHTRLLHRAVRHLNVCALAIAPTQNQKDLVVTGLTLGGASIIAAFFPICSIPAAITGLVLGLYGLYMTSLRRMASWSIAFSLIGLLLACINTIMLINTYIGTYLLQ